jgi:5-formyltetrahydrofolate cyclo-ligase
MQYTETTNMATLQAAKQQLRARMREKLKAISPESLQAQSEHHEQVVTSLPLTHSLSLV